MKILYNAAIQMLKTGFWIGKFFSKKLRLGYIGRQRAVETVQSAFRQDDRVIWMHAASLGEYEQGLPVLLKLKEHYPHHKVLVTFFSPSGYEHVKKKQHPADVLAYLPFDAKQDVQSFINTFTPEIFFTVKYDYWYNLLQLLHQRGASIYAISAYFYEGQIFFKPYGRWFVKQLQSTVRCFFHQTETSLQLAQKINLNQGLVSGDTRYDRVKQFLEWDNTVPFIDDFKAGQPVVVFGSAWQAEIEIAQKIAENTQAKIIIAPHDLTYIPRLRERFPAAICYSEITKPADAANKKIMLIDSIGLLSRLYSYADVAVIGGGFHRHGLHNILETAVYGVPVFFGNQYRKNPEADGLIEAGGAITFDSTDDLAQFLFKLLLDQEKIVKMSLAAGDFVKNQPNATKMIVHTILSDQKRV